MTRSKGVSTFVATLILVSVTLTLSYVVYEGVSKFAPPEQQFFTNQESQIDGSPGLAQVAVNVSSPSTPLALEVAGLSSQSGILYLDGDQYGTSNRLCAANTTTFFSVKTGSGTLSAVGNGNVWIDGYSTYSLAVDAGWHEVMFSDASFCSVTNTDGSSVTYPGPDVSALPIIGSIPSSSFSFYVPDDGSAPSLLMVFNGSYDRIA